MNKRVCASFLVAAAFLVGSTAPAIVLGPQVDTADSNSASGTPGSITIASFSVAANANRILLVGVATLGGNNHEVTGVTFGGSAMTPVYASGYYFSNGSRRLKASTYYAALGTGAATSGSIVATLSGVDQVAVGAISLYDAAQAVSTWNQDGTTDASSINYCAMGMSEYALAVDVVAYGDETSPISSPDLDVSYGPDQVGQWEEQVTGGRLTGAGSTRILPNSIDCFQMGWSSGGGNGPAAVVLLSVGYAAPPTNSAPVITSPTAASPATRSVQYSDPITTITITATDSDNTDLTASISDDLDGISVGNKQCTPDGSGGTSCTWDVTGTALDPSGEYDIDVTVTDGTDSTTEENAIVITVNCEDATVALAGNNPVGMQVSDPGEDLDSVDLHLSVWETVTFDDPDWIEPSGTYADPGYPGNINLTDLDGVTMTLTPVGPGSPITVTCDQDAAVATDSYVSTDYTCTFTDVPVNTYTVTAAVGGGDTCTTGDYYFGVSGEDVFTVFDPSLGYTTGGGWFYWPGTADIGSGYPGDKTNFGFTMKYNKKATNIQGSLLMIRHLADGTIYRVKSNALGGLAVGEDTDWGWASFAGKATYMEPGEEAVGNYTFITYVEDHGEPGRLTDTFWIEVQDKDGVVAPAVSLERPAGDNTVLLEGGNIVVPHTPGKKN